VGFASAGEAPARAELVRFTIGSIVNLFIPRNFKSVRIESACRDRPAAGPHEHHSTRAAFEFFSISPTSGGRLKGLSHRGTCTDRASRPCRLMLIRAAGGDGNRRGFFRLKAQHGEVVFHDGVQGLDFGAGKAAVGGL